MDRTKETLKAKIREHTLFRTLLISDGRSANATINEIGNEIYTYDAIRL